MDAERRNAILAHIQELLDSSHEAGRTWKFAWRSAPGLRSVTEVYMGQAIAYARAIGVVPPWSTGGEQ